MLALCVLTVFVKLSCSIYFYHCRCIGQLTVGRAYCMVFYTVHIYTVMDSTYSFVLQLVSLICVNLVSYIIILL